MRLSGAGLERGRVDLKEFQPTSGGRPLAELCSEQDLSPEQRSPRLQAGEHSLAVPGVVGAAAVGTIPIPTQQASETGKTEQTNPSPIAVALAADVSPHIRVLIRSMPHFLSHIWLLGHIRRTLLLCERAN